MSLDRRTCLAIVSVAVVLALLNLHSWRPGIGGRSDRFNGIRPDGSELELYYGWPACYQAELLRSDDPSMGARVLNTAPFYFTPYSEGWVSAHYVGSTAIILNTGFALLSMVLTAIVSECRQRKRWARPAAIASVFIACLLAFGYWLAYRVSVHL